MNKIVVFVLIERGNDKLELLIKIKDKFNIDFMNKIVLVFFLFHLKDGIIN